ncbi:ComEA family DNA-binding protein [Micromonospora radicis]|uniref:ComEA family DNA-binding protein n=2 Tax=Micromonospora radicis TaxID=1894971 RepID=A0A418MQA8_9ACTN|nr:ComEA family DNA-binding protein [Micromonospora radicis]
MPEAAPASTPPTPRRLMPEAAPASTPPTPRRLMPEAAPASTSPTPRRPPWSTAGPEPVADPEHPAGWGRAAGPDVAPEEPAAEAAPASRLPGPGAFDPGRRGVRALAAVAALVVLAGAVWAWRSRPQVEPVVTVTGGATATDPAAPADAEPTATPAGDLVVAVAGKVRRPGLVRVPAGARVADAIEAAGGALTGGDVALLNPARKVTDGELILVGVPAPTPPPGVPQAGGPVVGADPASGSRVNLNTATSAQLETLPGVGPVLARRIIEHRDQHGGFRTVGDLRQVTGIGDARYEQLKDLVTV